MTNALDIVDRYFAAFWGGDSHMARRYLADDLAVSGPGVAFATADAYLRASEHACRAVTGVEKHKAFVDGPDVGIFYRLRLDHLVTSAEVADWYHVEGEKICSIWTILDTAPFTIGVQRQPGEPSDETALDPVCHMVVGKDSAAATRGYAGSRYYFCSPGCAGAFDQEPEHYIVSASSQSL